MQHADMPFYVSDVAISRVVLGIVFTLPAFSSCGGSATCFQLFFILLLRFLFLFFFIEPAGGGEGGGTVPVLP